jgi:hypothetical protein
MAKEKFEGTRGWQCCGVFCFLGFSFPLLLLLLFACYIKRDFLPFPVTCIGPILPLIFDYGEL